MSFIKRLIAEFALNGKLLLGYLIEQFPGITQYPGIMSALDAMISQPNLHNLIALLFQIFLAGAAGHRLLKILQASI